MTQIGPGVGVSFNGLQLRGPGQNPDSGGLPVFDSDSTPLCESDIFVWITLESCYRWQ